MSDLQQIAEIILDLHSAGSDNDWTTDDLLEILRREDAALYSETLRQMAEPAKPMLLVA